MVFVDQDGQGGQDDQGDQGGQAGQGCQGGQGPKMAKNHRKTKVFVDLDEKVDLDQKRSGAGNGTPPRQI